MNEDLDGKGSAYEDRFASYPAAGVPIGTRLRGPLRGWAASLLDKTRLRQEGFIVPALIHQKWAEHLAGIRNWKSYLWGVLMFQAWQERWLG